MKSLGVLLYPSIGPLDSLRSCLLYTSQTKDNNEKKDTISNNQENVKAENKQEVKKVNTGDNTNIRREDLPEGNEINICKACLLYTSKSGNQII